MVRPARAKALSLAASRGLALAAILASAWISCALGPGGYSTAAPSQAEDAPVPPPVARVDYPADSPANWLSHQGPGRHPAGQPPKRGHPGLVRV